MPHTAIVGAAIRELVDDLRIRHIDIDDSARRLTEYSFDASNYRVRPAAVAFPRDAGEVRAIVQRCKDAAIPVIPRGGGTSMAGNAVGAGVVIDLSRWMTRMDEIDVESASIWVDAGVVLAELRAAVERGTDGELTFAPDPSSASRATIGGSIANDACGNHSVEYGRMTQHLVEIELVTADGSHLHAGPAGVRAVDEKDAVSVARAQDIDGELRDLVRRNLALLRTELQRIPRQVSGFHLGELLPENGFNVARVLAGSEGTCAIVVRARVALVPRPRATALLCLGYGDTVDSARDVVRILEARPSALESLDQEIVQIMRHRRGSESVSSLPPGQAYLLVELSSDTVEGASEKCQTLVGGLSETGRLTGHTIVTEPLARAQLWRIREDGAGLSSRGVDGTQTWPGWEDSAVAPERLPDYLRDLLSLIRDYGYSTVTYGHFGAGCVHMRLNFDFRTENGRRKYSEFVRAAGALVVAYGGSLSGEHGDGRARSELLALMYSHSMIELFGAFKRIWDPAAVLNPGIISEPVPLDASLALVGLPDPRRRNAAGESPFPGSIHACIGVGRCRSTSGGFMCPSYRATRDEKDSTRGRARVLQDLASSAGTAVDGWASPEVRESLDLCLSCKACSSDCPAGVDVAEAKSELMNSYYAGRVRPFTHYSIGWLPRWLPLLTRVSLIANIGSNNRFLRAIAERLGISARRRLPAFASYRAHRAAVSEADFSPDADLLVFVDSFTKAFRPHLVPAASRVLRETSRSVGCAPDACCGLTWVSTGQRDGARRRLKRLIDRFDDGTNRPIVVLEPSCAATIRDEGPKLVGGDAAVRVAKRVRSFASAVDEAMQKGYRPSAPAPDRAVLQTHCHEHAVFGSEVQRRALRRWGVSDVIVSSSCCGVAGNFGFEAEHFDLSMKVAEHSIVPALNAGSDAPVLTDGFSCAMQVKQIDPSRGSSHLAELLDPQARKPE